VASVNLVLLYFKTRIL